MESFSLKSNGKFYKTKIALACSLGLAFQASATDISNGTWDTFTYDGSTVGPVYQGYADWNADDADVYPVINNAVVNGVISTNYLDADTANPNSLSVSNTTIHGMVTSACMTDGCIDTVQNYNDPLTLTVDNSTIDDSFEHFDYYDADGTAAGTIPTYALGTAITLDQESNIAIQNNSHVAGITLGQEEQDYADSGSTDSFVDNITVTDSTVTSGSWTELDTTGFYGQSEKPSDYSGDATMAVNYDVNGDGAINSNDRIVNMNDVALAAIDNSASEESMKTNATFNNSTLTGDVLFVSTFNSGFAPQGADTNADGVIDSNMGYSDDSLNQDEMNLTLDNGSKWVGAAISEVQATANLYDVAANSLWPASTYNADTGYVDGADVFQSGVFNVTLDHGSEWDTRKASAIDTLTVNNGSQVNVESSSLLADNINLNTASSMNIGDDGSVVANTLNIDGYSDVDLTDETAALYANTITVSNNAALELGLGQVDTHNMVLTSGGTLDVASRDYVLNSDLNTGYTNGITDNAADYGVVGLNSDGHLAVNGDVAGNYKVRIDNATGEGSVANYKGHELIRVYDDNADTSASFTAANKADLGAYQYEAQQQGDSVVLKQDGLTDYANIALSIPSANTNIWNLEQDALANRLDNGRQAQNGMDTGGAWISYIGGHFNADTDTLSYDQDVSGVMVGLDKSIDGNYAKWIVGAAAGFAKGDIDQDSGHVDQDSQSARIYASAQFDNNVFVDSSLSYNHFDNDLSASMSNGSAVNGDGISSDAWGFGLKAGYNWKYNQSGYVTPYASVSGLFQDGDSYQLSNNMSVDDQSYDSMRYEAGINTGYTFTFGDQSFTPFAKIAYVYDDADSNSATVNGDDIDNGVEGSAVRAGLGGQFNFTKNFSAYASGDYLGGGDVDQDWSANAGVKYTW
ncbi:autotransporter outer membrane beta-barrel domain-containing protein [Salmonella enterica subsp. salamae]|nr:autotransporter outer membrane beta-barrel domain-containing protein [Salmonella enterica subsp. salamae]HED5897345.1 autotransporter outer membrane beta-barrel domain-containing protein [Salmonella enterica]